MRPLWARRNSFQQWRWACQVFGLPFSALGYKDRNATFRKLSLSVHPDKNAEHPKRAKDAFQSLNHANKILSRPVPVGVPLAPAPRPATPSRPNVATTHGLPKAVATSMPPSAPLWDAGAAPDPAQARRRQVELADSLVADLRELRRAPIPSSGPLSDAGCLLAAWFGVCTAAMLGWPTIALVSAAEVAS